MPNVLITDKGMDFVSSANDNGIYIDLRYFIPVYDDRIDSSVRNSPVLSSFSDIADKTITEPYGEKLWKRKHTLGDASTFLISAVDFNSSKLTNTYQKSSVVTNLYGGTPLSNQVSATSWSATGGESLWTWEAIAGGQGIEGDDSQPGTGADGFGTTVGYYPTYDGPDEDRLRGSFKFQIDSNWGNIKFNKIAMYAVAVDANGDDIPNSIGYFGEAYLSNVAVRSDIGVGYDLFEADVQIDLSGVSADWNDVFYSSSADYWSHSPGGLYYPGRIGVGVFEDGQKEISATMHIRRERKDGEIDDDIPQLRIDQDDNKYWTIEVVSDGHDIRSGEVDGGDMVINPGWEEYTGDALAIKPFIDSSISLGTFDNSFRELWLWNYGGLDDIITLNVENFSENYAAQFNGNQVLIGKSDGQMGDDKFSLRLNDLGVEITSGNDLYGAFKGGDIVRDNTDLLIYNTTSGDNEAENIYLFAGLNLDYTFSITDGQSGATHKNIMNGIDQYGLISAGDDDGLAPEAELHIAARGEIGLHGPIEIQSLVKNDDGDENNAIILSRDPQNLMFIGAGVKSDVSHKTIANRMGSGIFIPAMSDLVDDISVLYLVSNDIRVEAYTIMPLQDGRTLLGTPGYKFKNLYIEEINVENAFIEEASFFDLKVSSISARSLELDITAEDKISLRGPIEIQSLVKNDDGDENNAIIISRDPQNRMFIGAGVKSDVSYEDIVEKMGEGLPDPMDDLIEIPSDLFLVAGIVRFESLLITPIQDEVTNLGTSDKRFNNVFAHDVNSIDVHATEVDADLIQADAIQTDSIQTDAIETDSITFGQSNLTYYKTGSFEVEPFSDVFETTDTITYTILYTRIGDVVTWEIPIIEGESNSSLFALVAVGGIPSEIKPPVNSFVPVPINFNGDYLVGYIKFSTSFIYVNRTDASIDGYHWNTSGEKGLLNCCITYRAFL